MPGSATFHKVFFAAYGFGPYECFFCREAMGFEDMKRTDRSRLGCVHHIDENPENNHPFNLAAAHLKCHNRWHNHRRRGIARTREVRAKISAANSGRPLSEEHKAAIGAGGIGNRNNAAGGWKLSAETRAKQSAARKAWWERRR